VVDAESGKPVADAEVSCTSYFEDGVRRIGKTDREGRILFPEPEGLEWVHVRKDGYEPWQRNYVWWVQSSSSTLGPVTVTLTPR
jgi:hypothetical protein